MTALIDETLTLVDAGASGTAARQREMLGRLARSLEDLSQVTGVRQLIDLAPPALCRVGFDRAMISRIDDARWLVERYYSEDDPAGAARITQAARSDPLRLGPALIEIEMVRRRIPLLVSDVSKEPRVHRQLAEMTSSSSYVAAPVMPEGDVVGFLHADRRSGAPVDEFDREIVALFASQFGMLVHKATLLERFESLRQTVDNLRSSLGSLVNGCAEGSIDLAPDLVQEGPDGQPRTPAQASASLLAGAPEMDELLSTREREVLRLMALGETNTRIASRLVISEGTVKSHVRHILRKLGAANRAEAVCRWLQRPVVAAG